MGRTLLIGSPKTSWREWLKTHRGGRDLLCLDPADPLLNPPGRCCLWKGERLHAWRFYGSLDPQRAPHVLLAALAKLLPESDPDALLLAPPALGTPLAEHTLRLIAELARPEAILVAPETALGMQGLPVGPEEVALEPAFPPLVQTAQRKAQWLGLLERCTLQDISLGHVAIEGVRLGSGRALSQAELDSLRLGAEHVEISGSTLFAVAPVEPEESALARALDHTHRAKVVLARPDAYERLLCSFAHIGGEDFAMGVVESIDFVKGIARVHSTAVAPAPVRILRLGGLRVSPAGDELGEARPWQV